ncbi:hypothetical protein TNCV_4266201 [Trichonephila clavipes]|nr:hypothetical protein TNCV_4266201 [Trichonephila clavipes]
MAQECLTFQQRKSILKFENFSKLQRLWKGRQQYGTEPPTPLSTARLCDTFETVGTTKDMRKGRSGWPRASTTSSVVMLDSFTRSPQKSRSQCARETGVSRDSIGLILQRVGNDAKILLPKWMWSPLRMGLPQRRDVWKETARTRETAL